MNIDEIVFDTYVICPLCQAKMKTLSGAHLIYKHGYSGLKEFRLKFGLPMCVPLIAGSTKRAMQKHGKSRAKWFKKNVMPIGIEMAKHENLVSKEVRVHSGLLRRGQSWIPAHVTEMSKEGWIDLHTAAESLGIAYNYARKCATDGRLKTIKSKGVRFTKEEWIEDTRKLLKENREFQLNNLFKPKPKD